MIDPVITALITNRSAKGMEYPAHFVVTSEMVE